EEKWAKDRKTFTDEIAHLRAPAATHKDQLASSLKEKDDAASQRDALSKEKESWLRVCRLRLGPDMIPDFNSP
ncbi:hypothetical protein A2U01_0102425, partial [Trifolium medium]|nr:hypothetical protein [Trifolium medium]